MTLARLCLHRGHSESAYVLRDAWVASLPSQVAFELPKLGHGVLTYTMLRPDPLHMIETSRAEGREPTDRELKEIRKTVRESTQYLTNGAQHALDMINGHYVSVMGLQRALASGIPAPIGGGSDPLHLQGHCVGPVEEPDALVSVSVSTRGEGEAVLVVNSAVGWYRSLFNEGNALPGDPHEWTVDVVIMPVGWIGAFTRSPQTGLWHAGERDVHLQGN